MRIFVAMLYLLAAVGAGFGFIELLTTFSPNISAPQQGAAAARAVAFAVLPYVLARAFEGIGKPWPGERENDAAHDARVAELQAQAAAKRSGEAAQ